MQGSLWLEKYAQLHALKKLSGERPLRSILLPLYIYFDEMEPGHALSSRAGTNKFGAVYASLACLPPYLASKLNSILFSTHAYAGDIAKCLNKNTFIKLVEDLNILSEKGIEISVDGEVKRIYFQCIAILGDNLGLNMIFDMVSSFNANYCCRFCRATIAQIRDLEEEMVSLLRNEQNYLDDIKTNDVSKTGIQRESIFNKIKDFHIMNNITVDIMHDILEGVCVYVMRDLIDYLVYEKKYFTLEFLNTRIKKFCYAGESNVPTEIRIDKITKKIKVKMSAAEMKCFVTYFGLIISDKVSRDDEVWELYVHLRRIFDIVYSPKMIKNTAKQLKLLIKAHHVIYKTFFGHLKPKFHFLTHYPNIMLKYGPLIHFWCMRYES